MSWQCMQMIAVTFIALSSIGAAMSANKTQLFVGVLLPSEVNEYFYSNLSVPAVEMATDHINEDKDLLPNHEIVLSVNDSRVCDVYNFF